MQETAPSTTSAEAVTALAGEIHAWQKSENLSDSEMLRRFRGLGSDKTYKRLVRGDTAELDTEGWLAKYATVLRLIGSLQEVPEEDDDDVLSLAGVTKARAALLRVMKEKQINRLIFVKGDTGLGKTTIIEFLAATYGERLISLECMKAWNDNPNAFLGDLMLALGLDINSDAVSAYQKQRRIIIQLKESRRAILLDEGHHLGPRCLDVLKALINQTPGEFILFTMSTLWNRLRQAAYEECRQLTGNRLAELIDLKLEDTDIALLLTDRLKITRGDALAAAALLLGPASKHGNLRFVQDVIRRTRLAAKKTEVTVELIAQAATQSAASRSTAANPKAV